MSATAFQRMRRNLAAQEPQEEQQEQAAQEPQEEAVPHKKAKSK